MWRALRRLPPTLETKRLRSSRKSQDRAGNRADESSEQRASSSKKPRVIELNCSIAAAKSPAASFFSGYKPSAFSDNEPTAPVSAKDTELLISTR